MRVYKRPKGWDTDQIVMTLTGKKEHLVSSFTDKKCHLGSGESVYSVKTILHIAQSLSTPSAVAHLEKIWLSFCTVKFKNSREAPHKSIS